MLLLLALAFVIVPIAELAVIVTVADAIGVWDTIGLLIVVSLAGAWLTKREGLGVLSRIRVALDRGQMPSREVANGFLVLLAGALLLTPGFLTDGLGLLLLLPPSRAAVRRLLLRALAGRGRVTVLSGAASRGRARFTRGDGRGDRDGTAGGDTWDVESWEEPPARRDELGGPV